MKLALKIIRIFLMVMGVIFLLLLGVATYVIVADPFELRGLVGGARPDGGTDTSDRNPLLSPEQEAFVESIGIDPATLPQEITPEMESCLIEAVGAERASQIQGGATPSAFEILKAKGCL